MRETTRFIVSERGLAMASCATLRESFTRTVWYDGPKGARAYRSTLRSWKQCRAACAWARRKARARKLAGKPTEVTVYRITYCPDAIALFGVPLFYLPPKCEFVAAMGPSCKRNVAGIGQLVTPDGHLDAATRGGIGLSGAPHVRLRGHKIHKGEAGTQAAFLSATAKTTA